MIMTRPKKLVFRITVLLVVFSSCSSNKIRDNFLDLENFSIEFPADSRILAQSKEGNTGIVSFGSDSVYFNFGYDISSLAEEDPSVIYFPYEEDSIRRHLDTTIVNPKKIIYT